MLVDLMPLADLPEGRPFAAIAEGQEVVLVRAGDQVSALQRRCPHMGFDLSEGRMRDGVLVCPRHAAAFDPATGRAVDPARLLFLRIRPEPARCFAVRVEGGRVLIEVDGPPHAAAPGDERPPRST